MRRKKYLDDRLNLCQDYVVFFEEREHYGRPDKKDYPTVDFKEVFNNCNPVHFEIGCGKGKFVTSLAENNKNINYVAVEKDDNVIVSAMERAKSLNLTNLKFMVVPAENLALLLTEKCVERIYLNFSCPYPKGTYKNRRLTNPKFLKFYAKILTDNGSIIQKTDNEDFFNYSVESYLQENYGLKGLTRDLYNSEFIEGNVQTEYEEKFVRLGKPIFRVEAVYKNGKS